MVDAGATTGGVENDVGTSSRDNFNFTTRVSSFCNKSLQQKNMKAVTDFLVGNGACLGPTRLRYDEKTGWGLYATRDLEPLEIAVTVPKELCFSGRSEIEVAEDIYRAKKTKENPWISYLFSQEYDHLPLLWDDDRIDAAFRGLSIQKDLEEKRRNVPRNLRRAHAIVASRAYWISPRNTLVLAPLLDFANHHSLHGAFVETGDGVFVDENEVYAATKKSIRRRAQFCSSYAATNADLFAWFGFVQEDTSHVAVDFDLDDGRRYSVDVARGSGKVDLETSFVEKFTPDRADSYFRKRLSLIPPPRREECDGINALRKEERFAVEAARREVTTRLLQLR